MHTFAHLKTMKSNMKKIYSVIAVLVAICMSAEAKKVKGSVTCEGKGLKEVIVTDGKAFTQTRKNGSFRLEIADDSEFVYIVTPSGYVADWSQGSPAFYRKTEGNNNFDFELKRYGEAGASYNIIAVGDPQPRSDAHFEEFIGRPLDDICRTAAELEGTTVGIVLGDICYDVLPLQKRWKEEIVRAKIPFYPSVGNHDHDRAFNDDKLSIHAYRSNFGPENYAFFIGKDLMIVLDNIIYHSRSGYNEGYTEEIVEWVRNLMKRIPEDADIYVAHHSSSNGRWVRKLTDHVQYEFPMIINFDELVAAIGSHQITFLSGHNHVNGVFEYAPGVTEHNIAAICGTWWDTYHCTDGTPRGYKVFTKKDGKLSWYYKAIDKPKEFQYEIFALGTARLHPESIVVNIWDYDPSWSIEWTMDGKTMGKMEQVLEFSPIHTNELNARYAGAKQGPSSHKLTCKAMHYFAAKPSEDAKLVTITVKDRFGKVWEEKIQL